MVLCALTACEVEEPLGDDATGSEKDTIGADGPGSDGEGDVVGADGLADGEGIRCESDTECTDAIGELPECSITFCEMDEGVCVIGNAPDGKGCFDGDICTDFDSCLEGVCVGGAPTDCDDGHLCTEDVCDPEKGCSYKDIEGPCDDLDACTLNETCVEGQCVAEEFLECDDGNDCTIDGCDIEVGCVSEPTEGDCDDGSACTEKDTCTNGECGGEDITCDDENPCTDDGCDDETGCTTSDNKEPCDDEDACTEDDVCELGECTSGDEVSCYDGNECTDDSCDPEKGCGYTNNEGGCEDGMPCSTGGVCADGSCTPGDPIECDDGNGCTTSYCDPAVGGCQDVPIVGMPCDDGDACTDGTACGAGGECDGGSPVACDDGNPCTDDGCDADLGCVYANNTVPDCDTGDICDPWGSCQDGACVGMGASACDDFNPCTDSLCEPGVGCVWFDNSNPCDDGDPCTTGDTCAGGGCQGVLDDCDDGNPCTTSYCDPVAGGCESIPLAGNTCDDGNACTVGGSCDDTGQCVGGDPIVCDDGTLCTDDSCDPDLGCVYENEPFGSLCESSGPCWGPGTCEDGFCHPGMAVECDDGVYCTMDTCEPGVGCVYTPMDGVCDDGDPCTDDTCGNGCEHTPNQAPCDDGNPCTVSDTCGGGTCTGQTDDGECDDGNPCTTNYCHPVNGCKSIPLAGAACDDGSACTVGGSCDDTGQCVGGDPIVCDDGTLCTVDSCDPDLGCVYENEPFGTFCEEAGPCWGPGTCEDGFCHPGMPVECDDGNDCTDDWCDGELGCQTSSNEAPCDDGQVCTVDDTCSDGACAGVTDDCDDDNPCTTNYCDPTKGCQDVAIVGLACDDGDACTYGSACDGQGECTGGESVVCEDANDCTDDSCEDGVGCVHDFNDTDCDDGDACTTWDACLFGQCTGGPAVNCDDQNPCTQDSCDWDTGCVYAAEDVACNDGDACTVDDWCSAGECAGAANDCDDGNDCTSNECDSVLGCQAVALNGAACNDGSVCTDGDTCSKEGECIGGDGIDCEDGNPCTTKHCDAIDGCYYEPNDNPCNDDNDCTLNDTCSDSVCVGGEDKICDDGNPCTDNACDALSGCEYTHNSDDCDDGSVCTLDDVCSDGGCAGSYAPCVNDNPCLDVSCDALAGCVEIILAGSGCDDGNACTLDDVCDSEGTCGGDTLYCNDENPCTDDSCDKVTGCTYTQNTSACDDGDACTTDDVCAAGACGGQAKTCDDGSVCTDDSCDSGTGCVFAYNVSPCDDGNACTSSDTCDGMGGCGGDTVDCEDGNVCTSTYCDPGTGCVTVGLTGKACDDEDACTTGETCGDGGGCGNGSDVVCDDNELCTDDVCDPASGCAYTNNTIDCDDGNSCTVGDTCSEGGCESGENTCDCQTDEDCGKDTNLCNGILFCDVDGVVGDANTCQDDPDTAVSCDTSNDDACSTTLCTKATGDCDVVYNDGAACDDEDACTTGDLCDMGSCLGDTKTCDDAELCTDDSCDPATGCVYTNNALACDDDDACTLDDTCSAGGCVGGDAPNCDDANPCTSDSCSAATGCENTITAGADCTDDDVCTLGDTCSEGGSCTSGSPKDCDDDNTCTADSCDAADGCLNDAAAKLDHDCSDGNACTTSDLCDGAGACVGTDLECNDDNGCTDDTCDKDTGCVYTHNTSACDDGTVCTDGDLCSDGACVSGADVVCEDGDGCTQDLCDDADGCHYPVDEGTVCDDDDACTGDDVCQTDGSCAGSDVDCDDGDPCTTDSCDVLLGCAHTNVEGCVACGDDSGCDDGDPCTTDSCDVAAGTCDFLFEEGCVNCTDDAGCDAYYKCEGGKCIKDVPGDWHCLDEYYAASDGCDCACGAYDPDCDDPTQTVWGCGGDELCNTDGRCYPNTWTCEPTFYEGGGSNCDCDCGAHDPDCDEAGSTLVGCDDGVTECNSVGLCVPEAWACDGGDYGVGDACHCACGAPDPDCDDPDANISGCAAGEACNGAGLCVPTDWTCEVDAYGSDSVCDCACGIADPDCDEAGAPVNGCAEGEQCNTSGTCVPASWNCQVNWYASDSYCDCDCGAYDPDCDAATSTLFNCEDGYDACNAYGICVPETWTCDDDSYDAGDGVCDCDCGAYDPDCGDAGALVNGCANPDDTCNGAGLCVPAAWTCDPDVYRSDVACDCACGVQDPDCDTAGLPLKGCEDGDSCNNSGVCVPEGWTCDDSWYGSDAWCDCKCGVTDPDCDTSTLVNGCGIGETCNGSAICVPSTWTCDDDVYGNGLACDCACGAYDPDCDAAGAVVKGCLGTESCNASGICVPNDWTCDGDNYQSGQACDCDCGAIDPDCDDATLVVKGCQATGQACNASGHCVPLSWTCDDDIYHGGGGKCDCECGAYDPDCDDANSTVQGCLEDEACNGSGYCVPTDWGCDPDFYHGGGGICDCGCGAYDPDCDDADSEVQGCVEYVQQVCNSGGKCVPDGWDCPADFYDYDDYCDCNCDVYDPTCDDINATQWPCGDGEYCSKDLQCVALGSCCKANNTRGCDDDAVETCVCDVDAYCCDTAWDDICLAKVETLGCRDCPPDGWTCLESAYAYDGNCDCACGAYDPDCDDATKPVVGCWGEETCSDDGTCASPATWSCPESYYDDGDWCDCECGARDPDCDDQLKIWDCDHGVEVCGADNTCIVNNLVVNEIDYTQAGQDLEDFVEIYNPGPHPAPLGYYTLALVDGADATVYDKFALADAGTELAAGQYLVVGSYVLEVPDSALLIQTTAVDFLQNGPDAVRVAVDTGYGANKVDVVSYVGTVTGANEGDSHAGNDPGNGSLCRCPNGEDTDYNNLDFELLQATSVGIANSCPVAP